jgi:tRNA-Thr(GGU) m(6)t(6)A37 methyltransferase TsaA
MGQGNCAEEPARARETGEAARIELLPGFVPGLAGLGVGQAIQVLYWVDRGQRDLIVQSPRHTDGPRGVFALRSPVRPNPIALGTVVITSLDTEAGIIGIDATDAFDGTPVLDIKPWISTVDVPPGWRPEVERLYPAPMAKAADNSNYKVIAENRRARFDYAIEDDLEVGIMLLGSEVKSLRVKGRPISPKATPPSTRASCGW